MSQITLGGPPRNPVELEQALGLKRGDVQKITLKQDGTMLIDFDPSVPWPDDVLNAKLGKATGLTVLKVENVT